ncbi:hypothetical protein MTO96_047709 [Rhipicephalus appendiculatus]
MVSGVRTNASTPGFSCGVSSGAAAKVTNLGCCCGGLLLRCAWATTTTAGGAGTPRNACVPADQTTIAAWRTRDGVGGAARRVHVKFSDDRKCTPGAADEGSTRQTKGPKFIPFIPNYSVADLHFAYIDCLSSCVFAGPFTAA